MGTTADSLRNESGVRVGFVLAIEGYPHLLCDAADVSAVIAAWNGTGWTQARSGLKVQGHLREFCEPWAADINVPSISFEVQSEDFGRDVYKRKSTYRSQLTSLFEADSDGEGTLTVKSTGALPNEPGTIYLGNKAYQYSGTAAQSFTISQAESLQAFSADAGTYYSRPHAVSSDKFLDVGINTFVQTVPKTWIGRRVALYVHRIVGDVWDTRAEAQLEFAGRIARITDDPTALVTRLECEDMRAEIRDATILSGQWVGRVRSGIPLEEGDVVRVSVPGVDSVTTVLTVVASGASGDDEVNEGFIETEELVNLLNAALAAASLTSTWTCEITPDSGARRCRFRATFGSSASRRINVWAPAYILRFLGYADQVERYKSGLNRISAEDSGTEVTLDSNAPPFRARLLHQNDYVARGSVQITDTDGDFVDEQNLLPEPFRTIADGAAGWSFFRAGAAVFFGQYDGAGTITDFSRSEGFTGLRSDGDVASYLGLTMDEPLDHLDVYQVVVLAGSVTKVLTSLLASTGTGHNHATYDVLPSAMGCPGIPWSLLGDEWLASVRALEQATQQDTMMVVLDRPRKLRDIIVPQLAIRFAWLTFADGAYRLVTLRKPVLLSPDHQLTEANKASASGDAASLIATMDETRDYLRNVIKVSYSRQAGGEYGLHITARDEPSISEHGMSDVRTIELPDTYADAAATGQSAEVLATSLIQRAIPLFGKPLHLVRRTIAPTLYHIAVGDTVTIADNDLRHPVTGDRGVSGSGVLAGIVLAVTRSPGLGHEGGELFGMVEVLVVDADRTMPIAPAAEVTWQFTVEVVDGITFRRGYANTADGGPALKLSKHAYSRSTDPIDAAGFADGDKIRISEIDPADPSSADAWDRVLEASGAVVESGTHSYVRFTADLTAPSYDGENKLYRVTPQKHADVEPSQQLVSYLADDGDGLIQDLEQPNEYGDERFEAFGAHVGTTLPSLIATERGQEGRPLDAGTMADLVAMADNLVSHRCAPMSPLWWSANPPETTATSYVVVAIFWWPTGGTTTPTVGRKLVIAPRLHITSGAQTVSCRVTSSRRPPRDASAQRRWIGQRRRHVEFTHTGDTDETDVASEELDIIPGDQPGGTWITVELLASANTARLRGFRTFHLGPIS